MHNKILELGRLAQHQVQTQAFDAAATTLEQILSIDPNECNALQLYGFVLANQERFEECAAALKRALSLRPNDYAILINLGKALFDGRNYQQAIAIYEKSLSIQNDPYVIMDIGIAYARLGNSDLALKFYNDALLVAPNNADALHNKGVELYKLGKVNEALEVTLQCLYLVPTYFLAWANLGNIHYLQKDYKKCIECNEKALSLNPRFSEAWTNIGNALLMLGQIDESFQAHEISLSLDALSAEAWAGKGETLLKMKRLGDALEAYKEAYKLNEDVGIGMLSYLKMNLCEWRGLPEIHSKLLHRVNNENFITEPFSLLSMNSSRAEQQKCARICGEKINNKLEIEQTPKAVLPKKKLRIGYFSSDFGSHPVGQLIENVLKSHDKERFELVGFFLKDYSDDRLTDRIKGLFDERHILDGVPTELAIQMVENAEIDIAVDLNGYTSSSREDIVGSRIAPVQVSYLGYPGSVGLKSIDYTLADKIIIPVDQRDDYMGKVAYLPHYFPASRPNITHAEVPSRAAAGLPEEGFIYCCFNAAYKITPDLFDVWMRLLLKTPNSVLWLSSLSEGCMNNLRLEARTRGVDDSRLIFANRVEKIEDHLLRLSLADLFLDTFYYNAHTTACDALSVGVPVLTKQGNTFAGRVASSLLSAMDLTELIALSPAEYEELALNLAHNSPKLNQLKEKVRANRAATNCFDMNHYTKTLESFYWQAYDRRSKNLPPEHLDI